MDYNTEVINSAATQLAEMFKSIVMSQQQSRQGAPRLPRSKPTCEKHCVRSDCRRWVNS